MGTLHVSIIRREGTWQMQGENNKVMRALKVSVAPNHRIASTPLVIRVFILYFCHHYKQEHNKGQLERDSRLLLTVCQRYGHRDNKQKSNINRWHISHHTWNIGLHLKQTNKKSSKRKPLQVPKVWKHICFPITNKASGILFTPQHWPVALLRDCVWLPQTDVSPFCTETFQSSTKFGVHFRVGLSK